MQCRQGRAGSQLRNPQMDMRRQGMDSGTPGSLLPSGAYVSAPVSRRRASAAGHVPVLVVILLGLLLGLQPLATDLYLPALPSIQAAFSTRCPRCSSR